MKVVTPHQALTGEEVQIQIHYCMLRIYYHCHKKLIITKDNTICSPGGVPIPAVGQDVDNISGRVTSTVVISGLRLSDQGAQVTCTADNSALIQPQTTSVILDVIGLHLILKISNNYLI